MKTKILTILGLIASLILGYNFPPLIYLTYMDVTGHSKGWGYNLGSEKSLMIFYGVIEAIVLLALFVGILTPLTKTLIKKKKILGVLPYLLIIIGIVTFFLVKQDITFIQWINEFVPPYKR